MKRKADLTREEERLREAEERTAHWKRWGPYSSERAWGTVREDYSPDGTAWEYLPHDHARSKAYRWNEDGIAGICDRHQQICFAVALWNGRDPILKERLFGLTGQRGQPRRGRQGVLLLPGQHADALLHEVSLQVSAGGVPLRAAGGGEPPPRTGARRSASCWTRASSRRDRYFDVFVEYAKAASEDILVRISVVEPGAGDGAARTAADGLVPQHLVLGLRGAEKPILRRALHDEPGAAIEIDHPYYGQRWL